MTFPEITKGAIWTIETANGWCWQVWEQGGGLKLEGTGSSAPHASWTALEKAMQRTITKVKRCNP